MRGKLKNVHETVSEEMLSMLDKIALTQLKQMKHKCERSQRRNAINAQQDSPHSTQTIISQGNAVLLLQLSSAGDQDSSSKTEASHSAKQEKHGGIARPAVVTKKKIDR